MKLSTANLVLAPTAVIDLQLHTVFSDGTWTPEALLDYLLSEQFGLAAITDHDRVDTLATMQRLAMEKHMPLVAAVEISAAWNGDPTDVLCYGFNSEENPLNDVARDVVRLQQENTREVFENVGRKGYTFSGHQEEELQAILEKPSSQHPHALIALFKKYDYGTPEESAGKILVEAGCKFATVDIARVVDAAHRSGAVCLIAHPGRGDGYIRYDVELLDQLRRDVPIDGFEVYYPAHTPEQTAMYLEYAHKHNLLTSSGSDSHGPDKKPIKYRAEQSRNLLERMGIEVG